MGRSRRLGSVGGVSAPAEELCGAKSLQICWTPRMCGRRSPTSSGSDFIYTEIADPRRSDFIYTEIADASRADRIHIEAAESGGSDFIYTEMRRAGGYECFQLRMSGSS